MTGFQGFVCPLIIIVIIGFSGVYDIIVKAQTQWGSLRLDNVEARFSSRLSTDDWIANIRDYPWQAAIYVGRDFVGSGAIIGQEYVITSARLVYFHAVGKDLTHISAVVGREQLTTNAGKTYTVKVIVMHPRFELTSSLRHDLAIMKLTELIEFRSTIKPIELPKTDLAVGKTVITTGYYEILEETVPARLKKFISTIMNNTQCDQNKEIVINYNIFKPKAKLRNSQICTSPRDIAQTCKFRGNIGCPLVRKKILIGINSWGGTCYNPDIPNVYTRIYKYVKWIKKTMKALNNYDVNKSLAVSPNIEAIRQWVPW